MTTTTDAEAPPPVEQPQQQEETHEHTHENGEICEQHQVVFDLTILVPKARFGNPKSPTKFDKNDLDNYIPLYLPSSGADILRDVRGTVADSAEGFWIGMHSFDRVMLQEKPAEKEGEEPTFTLTGEASEVFSDSVDLAHVFQGEAYKSHETRRALRVVNTSYTDVEARSHVLRLRDTVLGFNVALQSRQAYQKPVYDPNALAIQGGLSIFPDIRGPIVDEESQINGDEESAQPNGQQSPQVNGSTTGKKSKGKGKAVQPTSISQPSATAVTKKSAEAYTSSAWLSRIIDPSEVLSSRNYASSRPLPLKSLQFSVWNPPPPQYRMKGHFIYLSVVTVEGENIQITGSQQGFFINRSDNHRFDPLPKQATKNQPNASHVYHSLFDLLSSISPQFLAHIQKIALDMLSNAPDFYAGAAITHCPAAAPWLVQLPDTTADAIRSQIPYALTGSTGLETLPVARDWNEEHTAMRELPRATSDDRLVRDRFGSRLQAEFQAAAARGVQCIVRGDVPSLNALDSPEARSYLFHNILFTQALDSVDLMKHVGGDEALRVSSAKDLHAMSLLANADVQGVHTIATAVIDYAGERWVAQSIPPGIFNRAAPEEPKAGEEGAPSDPAAVQPGLRAVYGPKDTEKPLDGYVADESFAPLAEKVAKQFHLAKHTVQDTHGKETAMWLPADVHGVAAADGRSYVIDLCRMFPVDVNWLEQNIDGQIYGEGAPKDAEEADKYPHRITLLRPELVETYHSLKTREWIEEQVKEKTAEHSEAAKPEDAPKAITEDGDKSVEAPGSATSEEFVKVDGEAAEQTDEKKVEQEEKPIQKKQTVIDVSNFKLAFNPDAFVDRTDRPLHSAATAKPDEEDADTKAVRDVSNHLRESVIPSLLREVIAEEVIPLGSAHLAQFLHKKGVNVRYLGVIAEATKKLPEGRVFAEEMKAETLAFLGKFRDTLVRDMIVRGAKHVLRRQISGLRTVELSEAISHFFNCLFGVGFNPSPSVVNTTSSSAGWTKLTPASLGEQITAEIRKRFRYAIPSQALGENLPHKQILRELCLATGIQLKLQTYTFSPSAAAPKTNGVHSEDEQVKDKKKKTKTAAPSAIPAERTTTFVPDDIVNVYPISKNTVYRSSMTEDMFERGQVLYIRGNPEHGEAFIADALNHYEQIYGSVHPELAEAYRTTANLYHRLAQPLVRRIQVYESLAAIPREEDRVRAQRETGFESEEAVQQAKMQHEVYLQQAARLARQAVIIMERTTGIDSAETLQAYNDLAIFEHAVGNGQLAIQLLKHVVELSSVMYGEDHPEKAKAAYFGASMAKSLRPTDQAAPIAYYRAARDLADKALGPNSIISANSVYNLGQCYIVENQLSEAIPFLTEAVEIFERRSGKESEMSREASQLLNAVKSAIAQQERGELDKVQKLAKRLGSDPARAKELISRMSGASGATAGKKAIAGLEQSAEVAKEAADKTGSRGHLDVDELVQFIQGGSGSKKGSPASKSKNGKKATGKR